MRFHASTLPRALACQAMNTSFGSLRLVNTYGAFGSITKVLQARMVCSIAHSSPGLLWFMQLRASIHTPPSPSLLPCSTANNCACARPVHFAAGPWRAFSQSYLPAAV